MLSAVNSSAALNDNVSFAGGSGSGAPVSPTIRIIGIVYFPMLIAVGCASNIVVVVVMRRTHGMSKSRDVFTTLALADLSVLLVNPVRYFITLAVGYDIRLHSDALCTAHTFLTYFLKEAATWILVLMTMERFLFARWPHRSNLLYRRKPKILTWTAALLLLFAKNLVIFPKLRVAGNQCDSPDSAFRLGFFVTTLILYSLVPFILMIVFNATLIRIIRRADLRRELMLTEYGREPKRRGGGGGGGSHANRMLVPVCLLHICLTMPQCVFEILDAVFGWKHQPSIRLEVSTAGLSMVMISQLNNAINGFVYFFSSQNFRRNVCHLVRGPGANGRVRQGHQCQHNLNGSHLALHQSPSPSREVSRSQCEYDEIGPAEASELGTSRRYLTVLRGGQSRQSAADRRQPLLAADTTESEEAESEADAAAAAAAAGAAASRTTPCEHAGEELLPIQPPGALIYLVVKGDKISHL